MGMVMGLVTLGDANIERVVADPPLAWLVASPDDRELYDAAREEAGPGPGGRTPADLGLGDFEGADVGLDKAWHGIHYLLTGTAWEGAAPLSFLLAGGRTAGDLEIGYGPLRLHTSAEVRAIAAGLDALSDRELRARFDPVAMMKLKIYPEIWNRPANEDDTLGYLMSYVESMRDQVATAVRRSLGLAIYLS